MIELRNVVFKSVHGRESLYDLIQPNSIGKKPLVIFCHGFKGYKDWGHFNPISVELVKAGFNLLKFNFTFNGGTIKDPIDFPDLEAFSENNYLKEIQDLNHIISLCKNGEIKIQNWNGEIYLLGHSRGGGMVSFVGATNKSVSKVVSWAGISDFLKRLPNKEVLEKWKQDGVRYIMNGRTKQNMPMKFQFAEVLFNKGDELSIKKVLKQSSTPQLIIHGDNDEAVDIECARELNSWSDNSELFEIEEANHVFGGKHPWEGESLPAATAKALNKTIEFFNS